MIDDRRFPFGSEQAAPFEPVRDTLPLAPGSGAAPHARTASPPPPPASVPTPPPLVSAALPIALPDRLPAPLPEGSPWSAYQPTPPPPPPVPRVEVAAEPPSTQACAPELPTPTRWRRGAALALALVVLNLAVWRLAWVGRSASSAAPPAVVVGVAGVSSVELPAASSVALAEPLPAPTVPATTLSSSATGTAHGRVEGPPASPRARTVPSSSAPRRARPSGGDVVDPWGYD